MKKYLFIMAGLIVCIATWILLRDRFSLYVDWQGKEETAAAANFITKGKEIYRNGETAPFEIRGVNLDSALPGHFSTDFAVTKEQYMEWFALIQEMGANTVKVSTIMDNGFYDALYEYNSGRQDPLYLIQSLWVADYAQDSREDAFSDAFFGQLKKDILTAVNVIHGNTFLAYSNVRGSGWYTKDISDWTLGITLGTSWRGETTAYTNHMQEKAPYVGEYYSATTDASPFESMLAELLDTATIYESRRYGKQHLLSIVSEPATDPFDYERLIKVQLSKYDRIDASHIAVGEKVKSGFYVSYRFYDFCQDILSYLTEEEKERLGNILPESRQGDSYYGYLQLLERYHQIPVVLSDYGFSSSRGITRNSNGKRGLTEREQGEALVELYQECREIGYSGVVISTWQDNWCLTDWNIYPLTDKEREPFWHNVQSESQGYGLLSFDPGEENTVVILDGDKGEWEGQQALISNAFGRVYCRQDEAYLYLLIEKEREGRIYIPFDITPLSGSNYYGEEGIKFEREADLILTLDGKEGAEILVHSYYDPWRAAWNQRIEHYDAYSINVPEKSDESFVKLRMILDDEPELSEEWHTKNATVADTGVLRPGNGDPESEWYDSQADYCVEGNIVEVRIPWQLLNFYDPSAGKVYDDYYMHYGIEEQKIDSLYLGLGGDRTVQSARIGFAAYPLESWDRDVRYHQRLKQSYYIVQTCWNPG